jgi:hypothetical protein
MQLTSTIISAKRMARKLDLNWNELREIKMLRKIDQFNYTQMESNKTKTKII